MQIIRFSWIVIFNFVSAVQGLSLTAQVHQNGITGTVIFSQDGGDTTVTFSITGLSNSNSWSILSNRMLYDRKEKCTDAVLGSSYIASTGTITTTGTGTATITISVLPSINSLTGRSILFIDTTTSKRTCAPIESVNDTQFTALAKLRSVIGGIIYFRQTELSSAATSIYANAFHIQNTASAINETVVWSINSGTCASIGTIFNPTGSTGSSCSKNSQGNCKIGDLSGKHDNLPVGETSEAALTSLVDIILPLSGSNSVIGKILVLNASNGTFLTCAKIIQYSVRKAKTTISRSGVTGTITFQQNSPLDATIVSVGFSGLNSSAGGYHIHKWPVPEKWSTDQAVCSGDFVSGHFNPFEIDTSTDPSAGSGTTDQYEIGDLSSKFGMLTGLTEKTDNYFDYNLPLFGINSVIGRSVVIHFANSSRWVCSTIEYDGTTITGEATFTYPVIGYIVFKQPTDIDLEIADTMIYTMLSYGDTTGRTTNHNWHVHVNKIGNDSLLGIGRCQSVGGHYNPFSVDLDKSSGNYGSQCNSRNPLRCEVGDMSGKHGQIDVRTSSGIMQRNFFTDFDLPLAGDLKILGRSIVIHAANSGDGRLSCANIYTIPNRRVMVKAGSWAKESTANVDGTFKIDRSTVGLIDGTTKVEIALTGLESKAGGYHVHINPVPTGSFNPCSASSVGGHFNPFGVDPTAGSIDGTDSNDGYEIGDLSRKYGTFLDGKATFSGSTTDTMLPVRGPLSITGRSLVIHKSASGNPRWVCGNITEDVAVTGGVLFQAEATFSTGPLSGSIYLTQYLYSDGGLSDTGVLVDLVNSDSSKTTGHNWHVHQKPVGDDAASGCSSPGDHYNPFMVITNTNYDECSPINPLRCELGDQSKKLGQYDIGNGRKFYTDVYLPLVGEYSVIGKSFVIHAANGEKPRIACADIIPVNMVNPVLMAFKAINFDKSKMVNHLASVLHTSPTNLAVSAADVDGDCMSVTVYMTGTEASTIRSKLQTMMYSSDTLLGAYVETVTCCSCTQVASIVFLVIAFIAQRLWTW